MNELDLSLDNFADNGCGAIGAILPIDECIRLKDWIAAQRPVDREIFYRTREEFAEKGRWRNYAPGRNDHNLLLSSEFDLGFIEDNEAFQAAMRQLCGFDWQIMKKSIIRSVPSRVLPDWVAEWMHAVGRPNLNPFVRDEFQDVQYFMTTDFHQDKTRPESDFVTVYVYLDQVTAADSALHILCGSHKLGMSCYPHNVRRDYRDTDLWYYSSQEENMACRKHLVTGPGGSIFTFHCLTLHGTGMNNTPSPRISLRYLIQRGPSSQDEDCLLERANREIIGPMSVTPNRTDVGADGTFLRTGSALLSYLAQP